MKLAMKIGGFGVVILIIGYFALRFWIGTSVEDHIAIAKALFPGTSEDALIEMLQDESVSINDKTHVAIWTLGQIQSEKALPILKELYNDDPEGETCYGKHDKFICQYEIYKAIEAIEGKMLFSFAYLNK